MEDKIIHYRTYIEQELLSGKSRQDVFNEVVENYDVKIMTLAEVIRRTPTLNDRKKYKAHNLILTAGIILYVVAGLFTVLQKSQENYLAVSPGVFVLFLLYGLVNFKHPAHLIAGILFTVISLALIVFLMFYFDWFMFVQLLVSLVFACLAFYLNSKLSSDYMYHREKVQNDLLARVDTVTFTN